MAVRYDVTVRNALCTAWATSVGGAPKIRVYKGTAPALLATAPTPGDQLVEFTLGAGTTWYDTVANGTIALAAASLPLNAAATASGTAAWYRIYDSAGTTCHEQGTVDDQPGADAQIDQVNIAAGQNVRITAWSKTAPGL
jgi:hypothetical protein